MKSIKSKTKGELTALRILDATAYCIATHGIEKTSITAVATKAKVSRGLVAHYFPQKSKIFMKVMQHIVQQGYEKIAGAEGKVSSQNQVFQILRLNLEFFLGRADYLKCFILFYYFAGVNSEYRKFNTQLTKIGRQRIQAALKKAKLGDRELAHLIHSQLVGAILQFHALDHGLSPKTYTENFLRSVKKQIKTH